MIRRARVPRLLAFLLAAITSGCALLPSDDATSVEEVLRHSQSVDAALTSETSRAPAAVAIFQQPLRKMVVNSAFGWRDGRHHDGLDLRAPEGTPIYATHEGIVIYAGDGISGYGNIVVIRHGNDLSSLYAHASALRVQVGERVARGECIAYAGDTGHATGAHLHFEIRDGLRPIDPRLVLSGKYRKISAKPPPAPADEQNAVSESPSAEDD